MKRKIKSIIFDFDGTLINSEPIQLKALDMVMKEIGIKEDVDFTYAIGSSEEFLISTLKEKYNIPDNFRELNKKYFNIIAEKEIKTYSNVIETLTTLKNKNIKIAIASNSDTNHLTKMSKITTVDKYVDHISNLKDNIKPKPAPDIFLNALSMLGVEKEEAIIVEDSMVGLEGAIASGIYTIAVSNTFPKSELKKKVDIVIDNINEIFNYICIG